MIRLIKDKFSRIGISFGTHSLGYYSGIKDSDGYIYDDSLIHFNNLEEVRDYYKEIITF